MVATLPQKLSCMNDPISMNNFTEIFKRTLIARCYYYPTLQMKPRLRKVQSPGPGSYHQSLLEAEPIFIPVLTPLTLISIRVISIRKIRKVKRLAFLCTHFKEVRHLIIKTFEVTSSFPPLDHSHAPLVFPISVNATPLSSSQETQHHAYILFLPIHQ